MKLIKNTGTDRVIDILREAAKSATVIDFASPSFSLFAFQELHKLLQHVPRSRLILSLDKDTSSLLGSPADRAARNRLQNRWLARECARWIEEKTSVRTTSGSLPQSMYVVQGTNGATCIIMGNCPLTTDGLGLTPGNQLSLIQATETPTEEQLFSVWYESIWSALPASAYGRQAMLEQLETIATHKPAAHIYYQMLWQLFQARGEELDEERIVKSATGIKNTTVWKKLYKFQRDGVVGAIEKLERYGGCIIADSVGLGKTFEALAIIKYYELRNDRVLVLVPKRLRDNWTLYKANDRRNSLSADRFNYDVLNHTDLSREGGMSGDIDLAHINWGNYDLVVIDESHNFRNKATRRDRETRYDKLMQQIIQQGVKTRVLMLSATPVNNRLSDLRNQIAFITEGRDGALADFGIGSIDATTRLAQRQFNDWLRLDEEQRTPSQLVEMLSFDYFQLLDLLTIARSRKHIEKYYGLAETGQFPERLKPINIKSDVDLSGEFRPIREINNEIRRLNLATYAPLRYVLPHKQAAYDAKYSTRLSRGGVTFRQVDREESLVHLMRVNVLKRMESAVSSFALTVGRQIAEVEATLAKIDAHSEEIEEIDIDDVDLDDPLMETLLVGNKVKVLLQDVDLVRWRQDLEEDRDRLRFLYRAAQRVTSQRDAKLQALKEVIADKCRHPLNPDNRKVLVFTAFADTANYLYEHLADWARRELGVESALVTGSGGNQTTIAGLRKDLGSILTAFSPRSKERPADLTDEGDLDLLIATDCISEGQNLQDCDFLINYDIHWNPVRIIQRFGRIDRIGSPNTSIQLVNFWPNLELDEYINLEQRVSGRMVLLDISATGEENLIEQHSGNQMNDLEYRRKQLVKLQDTVIDLEDLSSGISITDLTLTDFRIDLADFLRANQPLLEQLPAGAFAVTTASEAGSAPGVIFCLRAEGEAALKAVEPGYPLKPYFLVHVGMDGAARLGYTQAKQILDLLRKAGSGKRYIDQDACATFDKATRQGADMAAYQKLLGAAVASIIGKSEERAVASLFSPGGTHAARGEFAGSNDFEVVAFLVILEDGT